jgi:uncharacterized protein (TIGR00730 family)
MSCPALRSICVFCGSSVGMRPEYSLAAAEIGRLLGTRSIRLVYGGGNVGLMGVLADAALAADGEVIGVIPQMLVDKELAHRGLSELRIVASMHERKALMADLSDAFIALPGGLGTFEELCEILTWSQLGIHTKPVGCLNVQGYFDPLLALLDRAVNERFLGPAQRRLLLTADEPQQLLAALTASRPVAEAKPFDREVT